MIHKFYKVDFSLTDEEIIKLNELIIPLVELVDRINSLTCSDEIRVLFEIKKESYRYRNLSYHPHDIQVERLSLYTTLTPTNPHPSYLSYSYLDHIKSLTRIMLIHHGFKNRCTVTNMNILYESISREVDYITSLLTYLISLYDETYMFTETYIKSRIYSF